MLPESNLYLQSTWLADEQIRVYTIFNLNATMMEQWSLDILAALRHWPEEKPIRILFDLSHPNVSMSYFVLLRRELFNLGITEQGQAEANRFLSNHANRPIKLGVLLSGTMLGTLSKYVPSRHKDSNFSAKIFFTLENAQTWLLANYEAPEVNTLATQEENFLETVAMDNDDPDIWGNREQLRLMVNGSLEVVPISEAKPVILGRHPDVSLDLRSYGELARKVSRFHAQISLANGRLSIIDLGSLNGTLVSGRLLEKGKTHFIRRDDVIKIGNMEISIVF